MAEPEPTSAELLVDEDGPAMPWAEARQRVADARSYWLATVHPTGRPHVRPVLAVWADGGLYSSSSPLAQKGRNLAADGRCTLTARTDGLDLVIEATAARIDDDASLQRAADLYREKYEWPVTIRDGAFDAPYGAPTAGPPPYGLFRLSPTVVFGFGTDDEHAPRTTRWRF